MKKLILYFFSFIAVFTVVFSTNGCTSGSGSSTPIVSVLIDDVYNNSNSSPTASENLNAFFNTVGLPTSVSQAQSSNIVLSESDSLVISNKSIQYPLTESANFYIYSAQNSFSVAIPNTESYATTLKYSGTSYSATYANIDNTNFYAESQAVCLTTAGGILFSCDVTTTRSGVSNLPRGATATYVYTNNETESSCVGTIASASSAPPVNQDLNQDLVTFPSCNITTTSADDLSLYVRSVPQPLSVTPAGINMQGVYELDSNVSPMTP